MIIEAEYMIKEAIWSKGLFGELNEDLQITKFLCDSQRTILVAKDKMFRERINYIDIRYHFVQDIIDGSDIDVSKANTHNNLANPCSQVRAFLALDWSSPMENIFVKD